MSTLDLEALAEVARAATPGPWIFNAASLLHDDSAGWVGHDRTGDGFQEYVCSTANHVDGLSDGAYIAAASPDVVLALIERVRVAEAEREGALDRYAEREQRWHWNLICEQNAIQRATIAEAEVRTLRGQVARVEALADEWAGEIQKGHAENPHGHLALSTHEADLLDLRAVLLPTVATEGDGGEGRG